MAAQTPRPSAILAPTRVVTGTNFALLVRMPTTPTEERMLGARAIMIVSRGLDERIGRAAVEAGVQIRMEAPVARIDAKGAAGEVLDEHLTIACGEGALRPMTVQRAGRGVSSAQELLRGFAIPVGTQL